MKARRAPRVAYSLCSVTLSQEAARLASLCQVPYDWRALCTISAG
jgi:hypothetical protein